MGNVNNMLFNQITSHVCITINKHVVMKGYLNLIVN